MTQSANPLRAFFRQPAIYLRLPSDGQFWPDGALEMPPNRELPVLPMTAIDEITYRTPDALFNGDAIVKVVESCVPDIKNAWLMPNCDFNAVLTAIRIASYGKNMPINTKCPGCESENEYELDLQNCMSELTMSDYSQTVSHGDLEVFLKPMSYQTQTDINLLQFEQQRIISVLPASDLSEDEKTAKLNEAVKNLTDITVKAIQCSIQSIRTPQALVTEPEFILDFLLNCDRTLFNTIKDKIIALRVNDDFKPMKLKCPECNKQYEQKFTLDIASFFETAS